MLYNLKNRKITQPKAPTSAPAPTNILHNPNYALNQILTSWKGYCLGENINNNTLKHVNENIKNFVNNLIVNKVKNILLICSDYPGYGGAATNCKKIADFLKSLNFEVYSVYWLWDNEPNKKYSKDKDHVICDRKHLPSHFQTIKQIFKPDLVILKNTLQGFNLQKIFNVPVYFLIPGLFRNQLNKPYLQLNKEEIDVFLNKNTIHQILNSSYSFANSQHVKSYLHNMGIKVGLFYSTFVDRYNKSIVDDPLFNKRKYEYGLIVSTFDRPIKNIGKSIKYLKKFSDKTILIGKGSDKYKHLGFTCVDLVPPENMNAYYKQIKYIVQDSHFEACSNVLVESIFNGCKLHINNKKPKIVVSSTQYPGYGGGATNTYNIIKYLRKRGYDVAGIFFHNNQDVNYDPDNIGGIYLSNYTSEFYDRVMVEGEVYIRRNRKVDLNRAYSVIKDQIKKYIGGNPTICIGKMNLAPVFLKELFGVNTIFLVSGLEHGEQGKGNYKLSFSELMKLDNVPLSLYETRCLQTVDKIVFNSPLCQKYYSKFYSKYKSKFYNSIVDTTNILYQKKTPANAKKIYDIIVCCSNLERVDKNNVFLINILKNKSLDKYSKIIIGENYNSFKNLVNTKCLGLISNKNTLDIFSKSKILLFPSLMDANPATVREAYYNNCIPIITKNIGYYELFPSSCVCDSFSEQEWIDKINSSLENYEKFDFDTSIFVNNSLDIFCNQVIDSKI
tara:strand:- start:1208 stop:3388 length:2181 start_codon:yes stop_codon:yes gene_type:complete